MTKKIALCILLVALVAANAYEWKVNKDFRQRVEIMEEQQARMEERDALMEKQQAEKNASYENAIGFFKLAVYSLDVASLVKNDIIKFYAAPDEENLYDINGKYPEDYILGLKKGYIDPDKVIEKRY